MNKTSIILIATLGVTVAVARAQVVVEDPASIAQDAANQVMNLAKYVQMVENQVQQIETMTQELQQVTAYVKAFGDPSQIKNLTGASDLLSGLQQPAFGKALSGLQQAASGVQSLTNNDNGLYQSISNTSLSGIQIPRVTDNYKPFGALENTTSNYVSVQTNVAQQRQALKSQIADTVNQLQAATTDAETQKLQGVLTAQSAQLAALGDDETHAATQAVVQDIANRNDQHKQQEAQDEEIAADRQDALTKFGTMMVPDTNNNLRFGRGQ
jgi:hypothetical protein